MASIYELNKDYAELSAMLETAETEEDLQSINDTLEMINCSIEEKIENTAKFIKNTESDILGIKAEIDRLTALKKLKENTVDRLKNNVEYAMKEKGIDAMTVGTFKCGYRKSESVEITGKIPVNFAKRIEIIPDKAAIKKAIKAGETVDGAHIQTNMNFYIK